jgi:hypothetical protein
VRRAPTAATPFHRSPDHLLLVAAIKAAREAAGTWIPAGECLQRMARHFIETWKDALSERSSAQKKVLVRDRHLCQVPGCSRAASHAHHVTYRSHGGGDGGENLVAVCAGHHLIGIHKGYIHVSGRAPDQLVWELGVRPGHAPLAVYQCGELES